MRFIVFGLIILSFLGCVKNKSKHELGKPWTVLEGDYNKGTEKIYSSDGVLLSETPFLNSKPHGNKREFYSDGKLHRITPIEHGFINGTVKEYYKSGSLYKESPVIRGKVDGVVKKYHSNGVLMSEAPFRRGRVIEGLKEYNEDGKNKDLPDFVIKGIDKRLLNGTYLIELTVPDISSRVKYSLITNFDGREVVMSIPTERGTGTYTLSVSKNDAVRKEMLFEARFVTLYGNKCILRKNYTLVVSKK